MTKSNRIIIASHGHELSEKIAAELLAHQLEPIELISHANFNRIEKPWARIAIDWQDQGRLRQLLDHYNPTAVVNTLSTTSDANTLSNPEDTYFHHIVTMLQLLRAMRLVHCQKLVFISDAEVYGAHETATIEENARLHPHSPRGRAFQSIEHMIQDFSYAYGLNYVILRAFEWLPGPLIKDHSPYKLNILTSVDANQPINIAGPVAGTLDGSLVRDYITTHDLTQAATKSVLHLLDQKPPLVCNIGSGIGYSQLQLLSALSSLLHSQLNVQMLPPPLPIIPSLVADNQRAKWILGWQNQYNKIADILASLPLPKKNPPLSQSA